MTKKTKRIKALMLVYGSNDVCARKLRMSTKRFIRILFRYVIHEVEE